MGDTLDEPKGYRATGQYRCQQYGSERSDNRRKIIEETGQSENNDSAAVSFK
jgi:hypothetical protein